MPRLAALDLAQPNAVSPVVLPIGPTKVLSAVVQSVPVVMRDLGLPFRGGAVERFADDPVVENAPVVVELAEADAPVFLQQGKLSTEAGIALAIANFVTPVGFVR